MILYIENPKDRIRKLLELSSEFSKDAGYKINTQKSPTFLYTNNEKSEREVKDSIPFTIATKRIKHLGINLPKETKELYTENYKKEDPIPKERRPGGDTQCPRSGVVAWRSHPPSEARGGGQEEPPRF